MRDFARSVLAALVFLAALVNSIGLLQKYLRAPSKTDSGTVRAYLPSPIPHWQKASHKEKRSAGTTPNLDDRPADETVAPLNIMPSFPESSIEKHLGNAGKKEVGGKGLVGTGRFKSSVTVQREATGDYSKLTSSRSK